MDDIGTFDPDGLWISENKDGFRNWLQKHANKRAVLKLKPWYKKRTYKENRYLHWMFGFIGEELGYSLEDTKGWYKIHFGIKHTSDLTTIECEAFLEDVRRHCAEFHQIKVPLPNEVNYE